jgi:mRNA interferase RelE/StbE
MATNEPGTRRYRIQLKREAEKAIRHLPKDLARRIAAAIDGLAENPRPPGCKKLVAQDNLFRVRVGDWRIIYAIFDRELIVLIVDISPRGSGFRDL